MSDVVYLLEMQPYDPVSASTKSAFFSSGLIAETDLSTGTPYPVRIVQALTHETSIFDDNLPGQTQISVGSSTINNADGRFDYLLGYNWDGRPVTIKKGKRGAAYATFTTEFVGSTLEVTADTTNLVFTLRDNSHKLIKQLQTNKYAGSGGKEGGLDLRNKPKPLLFGQTRNLSPVPVDSILLTAQIHDGAIASVDKVYDRGVPLTFHADYANYAALITATIPSGRYGTCIAEGFIRLGAPPDGAITVDAVGQYSTATNIPELARQVLLGRGGLVAGDLNTASFTEASTDAPQNYEGFHLQEPTVQLDEFLETCAAAVNGFWYVNRLGLITFRQFKFRATSAQIRAEDIMSLGKTPSPQPLYRVRVNYAKNATVQNADDFTIPRQTLNGYLSKYVHYVQTDGSGGGGDYSGAGRFVVFLNDTEINDLEMVQFSVPNAESWISINSIGEITVTNPGVNNTTAVLRASLGEFFVDETFRVKKDLAAPLQNLTLTLSDDRFYFDDAGNASPAGQAITVTTNGSNLTNPITLTAADNLGQAVAFSGNQIPIGNVSTSPLVAWVSINAISADGTSQGAKIIVQRGEDAYAAGVLGSLAAVNETIDIFYQNDPPTTGKLDDLWFDTNDANKLYRHNGAVSNYWSAVSDTRIADALTAAAQAQGTADGKVKTYFSEATPTPPSGGHTVGDLWYRPSTRNVLRWNGSAWADAFATYGATAGATLYDSSGVTMADATVKNSAITISAGGVLSGAGGGTVTLTGMGGTPERIFNNLVDLTDWKAGAMSTVSVGARVYNLGSNPLPVFALSTGPSGHSETVARLTTIAGGAALQGQMNASVNAALGFNHLRTYRYLMWLQKTDLSNASGYHYFGPQGGTAGNEQVLNLSGVAQTNPWFGLNGGANGYAFYNAVSVSKWYLMVGIVHGSDYTGGDSGIAGIYDPVTGVKVEDLAEFKWKSTATDGGLRFMRYFGEVGKSTEISQLKIEEVNAGTVSIQQIMATVGAKAGTNLLDSANAVLSDPLIKNSAITINSAGVLSGAGGGTVTITGLGYLGSLNAGTNASWSISSGSPTVRGNDFTFTANGQQVLSQPIRGESRVTFKKVGGPIIGLTSLDNSVQFYFALFSGQARAYTSAGQYGAAWTTPFTGNETFFIEYRGDAIIWGWDGAVWSGIATTPSQVFRVFAQWGEAATDRVYDVQFTPSPMRPVAGSTLFDSSQVVLTDTGIKNSAISISSAGVLSGAGGGTVSITGLGYLGDLNATRNRIFRQASDPGAVEDLALWSDTTVSSQPVEKIRVGGAWQISASYGARAGATLFDSANATLADAAVKNSAISLSSAGVLSGAGGGTVTMSALDTASGTNLINKTQRLGTGGTGVDSRIVPANVLYSLLPSLKDAVTISDTDNGGSVTINIGSAVFYPDSGGSVTFPSGSSAGKSYATTYYIKRTGVDPATAPTGTAWNVSTTLSIGVGDVYINFFTTRATGGSPSPPPPPPPGDGNNCVWAESWVETRDRGFVQARDVIVGDMLRVLSDDLSHTIWEPCTENFIAISSCHELVTESGITLTVADTTPIVLRDGSAISPAEVDGQELPVYVWSLEWEKTTSSPVGKREVCHIRCNQKTYAAGNQEGRCILTHNPYKP